VKAAMGYHGSRYIQIDTPCPSLWGFSSEHTLEIARLGIKCGLVPVLEMEQGEITRVLKIRKKIPVTDYLQAQRRFRHLFTIEQEKARLAEIQAIADRNIREYKLED
jgi:pyruvate ferredoxin oxidoreductase beta subunit